MMRENFDFAMVPTAFGEPRAKRSQDNKPHRVLVEACPDRLSRLRPLEPPVASQPLGDGIIPSSAVAFEADPAPLIPARPFGLGWRFDEAPLVTPSVVSRQRYQAHPRNERRVAYLSWERNSPGSKPNGRNTAEWFGAQHESGISVRKHSDINTMTTGETAWRVRR
jgi:hypothetical protein